MLLLPILILINIVQPKITLNHTKFSFNVFSRLIFPWKYMLLITDSCNNNILLNNKRGKCFLIKSILEFYYYQQG
jgi:hypothetical protein